ncbi:MAG: hypothetical protein LVR00_00205 [Rhabdochlamydiaceae bacterium]|jgi:hypothetical protein
MKNVSALLASIFFLASAFCAEKQVAQDTENNPALQLNPQDVPFFSTGSPLEGLIEFNVFVPKFENENMNKKIASIIEKELGFLGAVVKLKVEDMRGFGAGVILNIQSGRVCEWNGTELPFLRTTLSIQAFALMQKTNLNCFPRVWAINDFVENTFGNTKEEIYIEAIKRTIGDFSKSYKLSNPTQKKKPTFYFY